MGFYDEVAVSCPSCRTRVFVKSKGADAPCLRRFELAATPDDVLSNVNRHSPHQCEVCAAWFAVDERTRNSIEVEPIPEEERFNNCWYHRRGR